jgi:hypothetical protein
VRFANKDSWNHENYIAVSLGSPYELATDCFKIETSLGLKGVQRLFTLKGVKCVALSTSDEHGAVVTLDEDGIFTIWRF